jgi:hypothetical protein
MSVADKVRKLAALAGSANEHEASAAARQACRLIREGKVVIEDVASVQAPRRSSPRRQASAWDGWAEPPPAPVRKRRIPRGPFVRRRDQAGTLCAACGEPIELGDAFSSADGFVHGDCIPRDQRP